MQRVCCFLRNNTCVECCQLLNESSWVTCFPLMRCICQMNVLWTEKNNTVPKGLLTTFHLNTTAPSQDIHLLCVALCDSGDKPPKVQSNCIFGGYVCNTHCAYYSRWPTDVKRSSKQTGVPCRNQRLAMFYRAPLKYWNRKCSLFAEDSPNRGTCWFIRYFQQQPGPPHLVFTRFFFVLPTMRFVKVCVVHIDTGARL